MPRRQALDGCPVCGSGDAPALFTSPDRSHGVGGTYRYRRCRACGSVYQDPMVVPEDRDLLYADAYYTHRAAEPAPPWVPPPRPGAGLRDRLRAGILAAAAPREGERAPWWGRVLAARRWWRERAFGDQVMSEMLPWRRPAGRALDVGCGSGALLARLRRVGWEVEGVEWDPEAARVAAEVSGVPVHAGDAEHPDPAWGPRDLVTLVHVFEHLGRPPQALRRLGGLLAPGGRLVLVYPNPDSLLARRWERDWYGWEVPRHLVLVARRALPGLAGEAGLRLRSVRTLARWAATQRRLSRRLRAGLPADPADPRHGTGDRAVAWLEWGLAAAGLPLGEELVVVLERPQAAVGTRTA